MKQANEQINVVFEQQNNLRNELEKKIVDVKREINNSFRWVMGIVILILLSVFGYFASQISTLLNKNDNLNNRVTTIETKIEDGKTNL